MSSAAENDRADTPPRPAANVIVSAVARFAANYAVPCMDSRIQASQAPFAQSDVMLPHHDSRWWGWTHYGIFLPRLPEPYRYLSFMTFIGTTGTVCFDNDYLAAEDARNTATVLSATAFGENHHYEAYDALKDCDFRADGSRLAWGGDDLVIEGRHPEYKVTGRFSHMSVDLVVRATEQVSYFIKMPIYDHFSVLATFTGTIKDIRGTTSVSDMCTVEYARCITPQALMQRPLPYPLKLPVTFFTYQIVNLDKTTQLLLTKVTGAGATLCQLAHLRTLDIGGGKARVFARTRLDILEYANERLRDVQGRRMRVPKKMRWTVDKDGGENLLRLDANVDGSFRYGQGPGYLNAYTFECTWGSRRLNGTGYLEWIDMEG